MRNAQDQAKLVAFKSEVKQVTDDNDCLILIAYGEPNPTGGRPVRLLIGGGWNDPRNIIRALLKAVQKVADSAGIGCDIAVIDADRLTDED